MKIRIDSALWGMDFLCLWGIGAAQALGQHGLASLLFTCTFPITLLLWLMVAAEQLAEENRLVIAIVLLSGLHVCINALLTGAVVTPSYLKKLIMFWCTVGLLGAASRYGPGQKLVTFLLRGNTVLACFLCLQYLLRRQEMFLLNGVVTGYLTFRFTNPNLTAMYLAALAMVELSYPEKGIRGLFHRLLGVALLYFVYKTQSRNVCLLLFCFLLAVLFMERIPALRPGHRAAAVLAALPLLFVLGYLLLVSAPWIQRLFFFLAAEGKGLDSRVEIWRFALAAFRDSPLVGAYSQISHGTGASQMHNTHLDILASYGMAVFFLVWRLLYLLLRREGKGDAAFRFRMALICLLLSGIGEASLFSGGMGIYLYAGMLRILANFSYEKETENDENSVYQQLF